MDKLYYVTQDAPQSANRNGSIACNYPPPPDLYILNTKRI
jgi:hypothetical protein